MGTVRDVAMLMLWLVALYLVVVNYEGTAAVLSAAGSAWTGALRTLQGR